MLAGLVLLLSLQPSESCFSTITGVLRVHHKLCPVWAGWLKNCSPLTADFRLKLFNAFFWEVCSDGQSIIAPRQYIRGRGAMIGHAKIKRLANCLPKTCRSFDRQQPRKRPFGPR